MRRGDIVVVAERGAYSGKPRPVIIVQDDDYCVAHNSITVVPLTSQQRTALAFRVAVPATSATGLQVDSDAMIDKIQAIRRESIGQTVGRADIASMGRIDDALRHWLAI
ncbi:type II toxin-antitoxin system PemK/MazF family toxin [Sandarakinorhabdus sp.]|uniref:type II toxin-antitoxin system PemK/MazF family toxin n=1 Tax=Sandarakinorhabdus sp. TaxID=1916663 RepID=UPI003F72EE26